MQLVLAAVVRVADEIGAAVRYGAVGRGGRAACAHAVGVGVETGVDADCVVPALVVVEGSV